MLDKIYKIYGDKEEIKSFLLEKGFNLFGDADSAGFSYMVLTINKNFWACSTGGIILGEEISLQNFKKLFTNNKTFMNTDIKALEKKYKEMGKEIEKLKKDGDIIRVPDCIKMHRAVKGVNNNYSIGIYNGKQELFYSYDTEIFDVDSDFSINDRIINEFKLVKCEYEDLEVGDLYHLSYSTDLSNIKDIDYYYIKIDNNGKSVFWDKIGGIRIDSNCQIYNHFYKVEQI